MRICKASGILPGEETAGRIQCDYGLFIAACAAASLAIGTLYGEQET